MAAHVAMRRPRKRNQPSASARGYGHAHQKLAAALLARWQPGDPCSRCGQPMWQRWRLRADGKLVSAIHLGHTDGKLGYRGLEHDACNLADGARITNGRRTATAKRAMGVRMEVQPSTAIRPSRVW